MDMIKLTTAWGVDMDVLFVQNEAWWYQWDKAAAQVKALVKPLIHSAHSVTASGARERGVSEAHTRFVKEQPGTANQAVRLFKAWVKCGLAERGLLRSSKLPSVALELIVLNAFVEESCESSGGFSRSLLLRTFLRALDTASRLDEPGGGPVVMLDAGALGYRREEGERFRACWGAEGPFIIHPIDPTCNVARALNNGRQDWDWSTLAREARELRHCIRNRSLRELLLDSTLGRGLNPYFANELLSQGIATGVMWAVVVVVVVALMRAFETHAATL
ncbi:hypothetical protein HYH03_007747 [Edaphochlamys debaryana]|uniref:2'-5'-oligoadenylate synthetase 1 domain-containing protein n=1 Tax=Edaphochlamys debaryana TaxID=47281 RepID=A0A835Y3P1_9CHLO|nr:hypothetical protein HYH03_007747 [Edaphochlamys debaryana]|eukprot:KAG2494108.1 hypothetical protein HYH03_007747 [Edaphochlamys debaryana]